MRFHVIPVSTVLDTWTAERALFETIETATLVAEELNADMDKWHDYEWVYVR